LTEHSVDYETKPFIDVKIKKALGKEAHLHGGLEPEDQRLWIEDTKWSDSRDANREV
jgi:hypothetical protein